MTEHPLDLLLPEICSLIDGFKGAAVPKGEWSEWDESVRARITAYNLARLAAAPSQSPPVESREAEPELCPYCDGSGMSTQMSDNGPDAYEMPIDCPHCRGNQTLSAAYEGAVELLKRSEAKHTKNYAIIWRRGLGDGDALTRMRELADALKDKPANSAWACDRLLELAATYEASTPSPAPIEPAQAEPSEKRILQCISEALGYDWPFSRHQLMIAARAILSLRPAPVAEPAQQGTKLRPNGEPWDSNPDGVKLGEERGPRMNRHTGEWE